MIRSTVHFVLLAMVASASALAALDWRSGSASDIVIVHRPWGFHLLRTWDGTLIYQKRPGGGEEGIAQYLVMPIDRGTPSPFPRWSWTRQAGLEVTFPLWPAIVALSFPPAFVLLIAAWRWRRKRGRSRRGLCVGCGYDLRSSPQRCPECGRDAGEPVRKLAIGSWLLNQLTVFAVVMAALLAGAWVQSRRAPVLLLRAEGKHLRAIESRAGLLAFRRLAGFDSELNEGLLESASAAPWDDHVTRRIPGLRSFKGISPPGRVYQSLFPYAGVAVSYWLLLAGAAVLPVGRLISRRSARRR